jgi:NAD dependent epimerase/dehydratase family enzyme
MHLILTGATGLVGSAVLHHMINNPSVTALTILSRRPVPQADGHKKVKVIIHKDFNAYPGEVLEQLRGAEGCVWAQGISITKVTKESVYSLLWHE